MTEDEVLRRRERFGPNELQEAEQRRWLEVLVNQFTSVIVLLLTVAAVAAFVLGDITEGTAVFAVLVINGAIGFVTEMRAIRSMESLQEMTEVKTRVRRSGDDQPLAYPPQRILVPTDGSRRADLAVMEGINAAKVTGARLHLLHVVETGSLGPDARSVLKEGELTERAHDVIGEAFQKAEEASLNPVTSVTEHGEPSKVIRDYIAENEIDPAAMGTHGKPDFSRYVMSDVSAKIVRTSPVPVMWVRKPDSDGTFDS